MKPVHTQVAMLLLAMVISASPALGADTSAQPESADSPASATKGKTTKAPTAAVDKTKHAKAAPASADAAKSPAKDLDASTPLDPGLAVPSARNRPATAATPTTGTRGFKPKAAEPKDKPSPDTGEAPAVASGQAPAKK